MTPARRPPSTRPAPRDHQTRDRFVADFDTTLLVEAGAEWRRSSLPGMPDPPLRGQDEPASPGIDEAGVDRAQIRAMLDLSPEDRLRVVEAFLDSVLAIRRANEAGRVR
jgi:hypothetical protein